MPLVSAKAGTEDRILVKLSPFVRQRLCDFTGSFDEKLHDRA
jgi:hypothetical protein